MLSARLVEGTSLTSESRGRGWERCGDWRIPFLRRPCGMKDHQKFLSIAINKRVITFLAKMMDV